MSGAFDALLGAYADQNDRTLQRLEGAPAPYVVPASSIAQQAGFPLAAQPGVLMRPGTKQPLTPRFTAAPKLNSAVGTTELIPGGANALLEGLLKDYVLPQPKRTNGGAPP